MTTITLPKCLNPKHGKGGYEWIPRKWISGSRDRPAECPKCQSPHYDNHEHWKKVNERKAGKKKRK